MPATSIQDAEYRSLVTTHAALTNNPHTVTLTQAAAAGGTLGIGSGGTGRTSWNADSFAITDGIGTFSSGGISVPAGDVVGTTATQDLSNKTFTDTIRTETGAIISEVTGASIGFELNVENAGHTGSYFQLDDEGTSILKVNATEDIEMASHEPREGGIYQWYTAAGSFPSGGTLQPKNAWFCKYDGALANNKDYRVHYVHSSPQFNATSSGMNFYGGYFECKNAGSTASMTSSSMVGGAFFFAGQQTAGDLTNSTTIGGLFQSTFANGGTETHTTVTGGQFYADPTGGTNKTVSNNRVVEVKGPSSSIGAGSSCSNYAGIYVHDQRNDRVTATNHDAIRVLAQTADGSVATDGNINMIGGDWDDGHLQLGSGHIWYDGTNWRAMDSAPSSATDSSSVRLVPQVASYYEAGTTTLTGSAATIDIDSSHVADANFSLSAGEVTVNSTIDRLQITYDVTTDTVGNSRDAVDFWLEENTGAGFTTVAGTDRRCYNRVTGDGTSASATVILAVTSGDIFRIRGQRQGAVSVSTLADGSALTFIEL